MASSADQFQIAQRYAAALFDLALEGKVLDKVAADLQGLKTMIGRAPELKRLLESPAFSREEQESALAALLKKGKAQDLTGRYIAVVARNRRLGALEAMIDAFFARLSEHRGEISADIVTAAPLGKAQESALAEALKKAMGRAVTMAPRVDETLIGGIIVKIGSRMIDTSLKTKLLKLKLAMKGVA